MAQTMRTLFLKTMNNRSAAMGDKVEITNVRVEEPLSPTSRLMHEPQFNHYVIAILGLGKKIDVNMFKAWLEATIVHHPRFSSIQVWDEPGGKDPKWVPTKPILDDHVLVPDLSPAIASAASPEQVGDDYIASLSTSELDPSRPLWELHLLDIRSSESEGLAVFRMHHSLGDGTSLVSLLLACTRKTSQPDSLPTLPVTNRPPARRSLLLRVIAILALLWNTLVDSVVLVATLLFLKDTETPLKAPKNSKFRRNIRLVHLTISLDDVKTVKNALRCTVNDVLIGVISAALSRYLSRKYSESGGQEGEKKRTFPKGIRLRTPMMVNIRPTPGIPALARMMEGDSGGARWGNSFGFILLSFPIGMCEDPLDYVRKGKEVADRKKNSLAAISSYFFTSGIMRIFGVKAALVISQRVLDQTTLVFSNLVGPVEEIQICGHPITYVAAGVYGLPHAVAIHFLSYMNKMKMVLTVDEMVVPDPHQLLEDLTESLKVIKDAAVPVSSSVCVEVKI